jgi:hypothetical protein
MSELNTFGDFPGRYQYPYLPLPAYEFSITLYLQAMYYSITGHFV